MRLSSARPFRSLFSCCALLIAFASAATDPLPRAHADEGQWTPDQIHELDAAALAAMGLELSPAELWNPAGDERTGGLMRAVVNFGGCTASFISATGLLATNHHCAYGALQANSTPEHDYLQQGFLARSREQELETKGRTARVLLAVTDVTEDIRGPAEAEKSDSARQRVIERAMKELISRCEAGAAKGRRCQVASFYSGSQYRLMQYLELPDVRVVYAPPASIGEYGGEVDNWMWPRHTGDFAILRAYVGPDGEPAAYAADNVPYQPAQHLTLSTEGVSPGDFVAILGYPGRTTRYLSAPEIQRQIEQVLPFKVDFYGEWIDILEAHGQRDPAVRIKVAALQKRLANRHKNARGMLDGLAHMQVLDQRRAQEQRLRAAFADEPEYAGVLDELGRVTERARERHVRSALVRDTTLGPNTLAIGIHLVRKARAAGVPDLERPAEYQEREWQKLWKRVEGHVRDHDAEVDAALLASLLAREAGLPDGQRIAPLRELAATAAGALAKQPTRDEFLPLARKAVQASKLFDRQAVESLWNQADAGALAASDDPMVRLANRMVDVIEAEEQLDLEYQGALSRLQPRYFEMLKRTQTGPLYPDANGTLRFSYATVQGYDKWDGQAQAPRTTLAGALAKHTGAEPFDLPARVRERAPLAKDTHWAESELGDLALCFLANGDTTGGNSGSPVIDGKGRLVGLNFDRVWENIAGDFNYYQGHSRNIIVDIRFLLWMLDQVDGADQLLGELGVSELRGLRAREKAAPVPSEPRREARGSGCGCAVGEGGSRGGAGWLAGALAIWLTVWLAVRLPGRAYRRRSRAGA